MLRFHQEERKGVYSRKREYHEKRKRGEKCQTRLKNKRLELPGEQTCEEELMRSERFFAWETGALDGRRRRLYIIQWAVASY